MVELLYFNVSSKNESDLWSWTIEVDTARNHVIASNGINVWQNTSFLLNKPSAQQLIVSLRQLKVNVIPEEVGDENIQIVSTKFNCQLKCKRTNVPNELQKLFHRMSLHLCEATQKLKNIENGTDDEFTGHSVVSKYLQDHRKKPPSYVRPGMSAVNPHARKRKKASGIQYEE